MEIEADVDRSHPIELKVGRQGDCVVLGLGGLVIALPAGTAQEWAETVLAEVAAIKGVEAFMITMSAPGKKGPMKTIGPAST